VGSLLPSPRKLSSGTATAVPATTAPVAMRTSRPRRVSRIVLRGGVFLYMRAR
jgi:hypothetical protein